MARGMPTIQMFLSAKKLGHKNEYLFKKGYMYVSEVLHLNGSLMGLRLDCRDASEILVKPSWSDPSNALHNNMKHGYEMYHHGLYVDGYNFS